MTRVESLATRSMSLMRARQAVVRVSKAAWAAELRSAWADWKGVRVVGTGGRVLGKRGTDTDFSQTTRKSKSVPVLCGAGVSEGEGIRVERSPELVRLITRAVRKEVVAGVPAVASVW